MILGQGCPKLLTRNPCALYGGWDSRTFRTRNNQRPWQKTQARSTSTAGAQDQQHSTKNASKQHQHSRSTGSAAQHAAQKNPKDAPEGAQKISHPREPAQPRARARLTICLAVAMLLPPCCLAHTLHTHEHTNTHTTASRREGPPHTCENDRTTKHDLNDTTRHHRHYDNTLVGVLARLLASR